MLKIILDFVAAEGIVPHKYILLFMIYSKIPFLPSCSCPVRSRTQVRAESMHTMLAMTQTHLTLWVLYVSAWSFPCFYTLLYISSYFSPVVLVHLHQRPLFFCCVVRCHLFLKPINYIHIMSWHSVISLTNGWEYKSTQKDKCAVIGHIFSTNWNKFVNQIERFRTSFKYQSVFEKHYSMPPAATKSKKLFLASRSKSRSQGHWPWCHLKGHH